MWASVAAALLNDNWKERIAALDRALECGGLSADQGVAVLELMVAKAALLLSDSHSVIVAKSIALLTMALRTAQRDERFTAYSKRLSLVLLDRLKVASLLVGPRLASLTRRHDQENKAAIVGASEDAIVLLRLDAGDLGEVMAGIMAHTVPKVRQKGLLWVEKMLAECDKQWLRPALRQGTRMVCWHGHR